MSNFNVPTGQRIERKKMLTVVEWSDGTGTSRELLGSRTEDSSMEYNPDVETITDILGVTHTEVNKTEPSQTFDPYTLLGGSKLGPKLDDIRKRNAVAEFSQFTVYVITAYKGTAGAYEAEKHTGCTIEVTSLGGSAFMNMPINVHLSNDCNGSGAPQLGTVDKLGDDFVFTPTSVG